MKNLKTLITNWLPNDAHTLGIISNSLIVAATIGGILAAVSGYVLPIVGDKISAIKELETAKQMEISRSRQQKAEKELAELKESFKPRRLSESQQSELTSLLQGGPKGELILWMVAGDKESIDYGEQFYSALHDAGWKVTLRPAMAMGPPRVGLEIYVKKGGHEAPPRAAYLQNALAAIGLNAEGEVKPGLGEDVVELSVGVKTQVIK